MAGIDITEPAGAEGDTPVWEIEPSGVTCTGFANDGKLLRTALSVSVRKHVLAVSVNPDIGTAVGYQPAAPQYLYPGYHGEVDVVLRTEDDAAKAALLPWLVRLHVVPVTVVGD